MNKELNEAVMKIKEYYKDGEFSLKVLKPLDIILNYIENSISKETIKEKEKEANYRLNETMITERDMYYNLGKKEVLQELLEVE